MEARRSSSTNLYAGYITKWMDFCNTKNIDPVNATVSNGLDFLVSLFDENTRSYSALNTARCALSLVIIIPAGVSFGKHPDVVTFMKGVSNLKPSVPKYVDTWDPDLVLKLFKLWAPAKRLSLKVLTFKTIVLLLLVSGQRPQIIQALTVDNMKVSPNSYKFFLQNSDLKQGRRNYKPEVIHLKKYAPNPKLCIHHYLTEYLNRTLYIRGKEKSVFLTTTRPFHKPSTDTVGRWIKKVLRHAGVDTKLYSAGSTRAASTSKAQRQGVNVDEILKAGGWTRQSTFVTYYNKPLKSDNNFSQGVLKMD